MPERVVSVGNCLEMRDGSTAEQPRSMHSTVVGVALAMRSSIEEADRKANPDVAAAPPAELISIKSEEKSRT